MTEKPAPDPDREHSLELGHGLEMQCSTDSLDDSMRVRLTFRGRQLLDKTFTADEPRADFDFDLHFVRGDGMVEIDMFEGELAWAAHLEVRDPHVSGPDDDEWESVIDVDRRVVMRFAPAIGSVGDEREVHEPRVEHAGYGRTQLCTPAVLRIPVDDERRSIADVGRHVKAQMFPDHPPFVFNTVACVGQVEDGTPGSYPDPDSTWFNIFLGYYQLDCPKSGWDRPFGYRSADGAASEVEAEDVVRIGKSDWNWFSNWMYGVPESQLEPLGRVDMAEVGITVTGPEQIGESLWHTLRMDGVEVASCYESNAEGAAKLETNTIIDDVWRNAFGLPNPRPDHPESFIAMKVDALVDLAYWEDDDAFHTVIFGGTAAPGTEPSFLDAQLEATRAVISEAYPRLGFPL